MAKRRRLTALPGGPETDMARYLPSAQRPPLAAPDAPPSAPIAQVTGASAAAAAFDEVSAALTAARAEGRLIQRVPLDAIDVDHLVRDRLAARGAAGGAGAEDEGMAGLIDSLRARGQQVPVEVVEIGDGRFGLISGWRRVMALGRLHAETGEDRFATALALLRRPASAADAYVAMVEENEVRTGLSYYERARIVARAADLGVFPDEAAALRTLFASASRARRSKIGSFLAVYHALDGRLAFPGAIPERLGLALARALEGDARLAARLADRLRKAAPADPAGEQALLQRVLDGAPDPDGPAVPEPGADPGPDPAPDTAPDAAPDAAPDIAPAAKSTLDRPEDAEEVAYGIWLQRSGGALRPRYTLSGPRVDDDLRARLVAWLRGQD